MGTQVNYLAALELVSASFKSLSKDEVYQHLATSMSTLEDQLRDIHQYDIFRVNYSLDVKIKEILESLYTLTGANVQSDLGLIYAKDAEYGGSWQKRGGQGAFMMLCRKWDRIKHQVEQKGTFMHALYNDTREEGISDDLTDLRCYFLLVLAWRYANEHPADPPTEDMPF